MSDGAPRHDGARRGGRRRVASLLSLLALIVAAEALLVARTIAVDERLARLSSEGEFARVFPPGEIPARILPGLAADGYEWMRLTREMTESGAWRLRWCSFENAPFGRPVYWHSGLAWWIAGLSRLDAALTGKAPPQALEQAATWASPLLLMLALPFVLLVAWRRLGLAASAALAAWMVGDYRFMEGFLPGYPDHHGEISLAVLGLLMGIVVALGETLSPAARRRAILVSAFAGAAGLWISALSFSFTLVAAGIGLLVATRLLPRPDHAALLRLWGRVGAAASLGFYLLEQCPDRFGMRLEVNHPLHALAWLAGAELLALACGPLAATPALLRRLALALPSLLALPVAIVAGGARWFAPEDAFLLGVHARISEFQPLVAHLRTHPDQLWVFALWIPCLAAAAVLAAGRLASLGPVARARVGFALPAAIVLAAMQLLQIRWGLVASGAMAVLLACVVAALAELVPSAGPRRVGALLLILGPCAIPASFAILETARARELADQPAALVTKDELVHLQHRDVARVLREDARGMPVTVLSSPSSTLLLDSFGPFSGLGTLYWENGDGLRAAARLWSAPTSEALPLLLERGVTHVAVFSWENFIAESFEIERAEGREPDMARSFGAEVGLRGALPLWLRAIPYPTTSLMRANGLFIRLYAVDPAQGPADALLHLGEARFVDHDIAGARAAWTRALEADPSRADIKTLLDALPAADP